MKTGIKLSSWQDCYSGGWNGLIVPEAFAHPAKMAYGLLSRIITHGLAQGYWSPGSVIGDPFGGIGSTGLICSYNGLASVSVELEPRFVALARDNFELHRRKWEALGAPQPVILQGDSRAFSSLVGQCEAVVTSPPFQESLSSGKLSEAMKEEMRSRGHKPSASGESADYGTTPWQIGSLPAGDLDAVVTSPPYVSGGHHADQTGAWNANGRGQGMSKDEANYGETEGQIGRLPAGGLDAVVTSPPWENQVGAQDKQWMREHAHELPGSWQHQAGKPGIIGPALTAEYGSSNGQIGNDAGDTYWQAMAQVYEQCRLALRPGGVLVVVIKSYVKGGKLVDLPSQTCELLTRLGFAVFERTRCHLVKETEHTDLFDGKVTKRKERKSFFRRLAEKKGSPRVDWEEVLWCRKPEDGGGDGLAGVVTSPPYAEGLQGGGQVNKPEEATQGKTRGEHCFTDYGQTPGQIGALPAGEPPQ